MLLKNAKVVLPDREVDADVQIVDGKIAAIGRDLVSGESIDLAGATVEPGRGSVEHGRKEPS